MKATKIKLNGESRIRVEFPDCQQTVFLIKQIADAKWSSTMNAWHIPYSNVAFAHLRRLFPLLEYPKNKTEETPDKSIARADFSVINDQNKLSKNVSVQVIGRKIIIKLPKNALDTHFIASLRYSRWDGKQFCWIVPNYPGNIELINDYFNERIYELIVNEDFDVKTSSNTQRKIRPNELLIIKTTTGRLKLIFVFNRELGYLIKKIPYNYWDAKNRWWTIPYSERFLSEIKIKAQSMELKILYEEEIGKEERVKRISPYDIANYHRCPEVYSRKLYELRYTPKTIKTYQSMFEEFINYYNSLDIMQINDKQIIAFLQYLVTERNVSTSYQNQSINAIKFFYEHVLGGVRKFYFLERPRKEKRLPNVLNEKEITKTIKLVKNVKHKALIMITYSGGLRISEVISLKVKDIDSQRMQIFVRQAKGRKDRYTLLSKKALAVLRDYFREYKPEEWLFEGIKGRQYSESSIYTVVKEAFQKAGIKKKASPHTLRHCFGTHLLENGTDIRYIQVLMGHASIKTTEIYTHMTTKGFDKIENPLDKLEI